MPLSFDTTKYRLELPDPANHASQILDLLLNGAAQELQTAGSSRVTTMKNMPRRPTLHSFRQALDEQLANQQVYLRVTKDLQANEVVAFHEVSLATPDRPYHFINALYVAITAQRQGIGTTMRQVFEDQLTDTFPIRSLVLQGNGPMEKLCARQNYQLSGLQCNGDGITKLIMIKQRGGET